MSDRRTDSSWIVPSLTNAFDSGSCFEFQFLKGGLGSKNSNQKALKQNVRRKEAGLRAGKPSAELEDAKDIQLFDEKPRNAKL